MEARIEIVSGMDAILRNFDRRAAALENPENVLRGAVGNLYVLVSERIQQQGLATDGTPIGGGRYSASGARGRAKRGRQTGFIDLTDSGDTLDRSFTYGPVPEGGWGLGFVNKLGADRMALNERRYNQKIITPSAAEMQLALVDILEAIREQIRNPS